MSVFERHTNNIKSHTNKMESDSIKMEIDQDVVRVPPPSRRLQPLKTCVVQYYYLDVEMDSEFGKMQQQQQKKPYFTADLIKAAITNAVKVLFGEFGAATDIDILQFDQKTMRLILRCPADFYVKLRAALTVASTYMETDCYYKVIKAAPCLMQLASNSLLFEHR